MTQQRKLIGPFKSFDKYGFTVSLPDMPVGDISGNAVRSRLYLYEDGKQVGEAHHGIGSVGAHGFGRFVHWDTTFYFSTTDGTNANNNGREYSVVWSDDLYFKERSDYFHSVLKNILAPAGLKPQDLAGKNVLEIGCGRHHGMSLIMAGYGANVVAVDRYAPRWDDEFHADYISYLIRQGTQLDASFDGNRLKNLLAAKSFDTAPFTFFPIEAEALAAQTKTKFDVQLSVAALEHFYDMNLVADMLFKTANPGAIGSHSVDFRDHRDFARPLDFLLLTDEAYDELSGNEKYVHGNRLRPKDFEALWPAHGFINLGNKVIDLANDNSDYMKDFLPKLRSCGTRFANEPEETLRHLAVIYMMKKPV